MTEKRPSPRDKINVLVVDDHRLFRQGIHWAMELEEDIEIVGEAVDGLEALQMAEDLLPDVVLMDVNIPDPNGLEATRRLKLNQPRIGVIILTAYDDEEQLFQAIRAGAAAYYSKGIQPRELAQAIRRVARGEYIIDNALLSKPLLASRVLKEFSDLSTVDHTIQPFFAPLSPREMEVLTRIAHGDSNKEIARTLSISDQTVKNHISSILRKLNVNDRTQAAIYALRQGWVKMKDIEIGAPPSERAW
ncbi:MAG: response regulator transcription factor [Chloroflexi bacterium]|nr:response regulator transcription factor [Chloroflexota bacterium]MBU1749377.1 response regulator transcription factor [Chloroflexota bacterium]MBU1879620.1 response regulator transcription factor [Chloroflexota bacterium]